MRVGPTLLACCLVLGGSLFSGEAAAQSIRAAALAPQLKSGGSTPELRDKFHEAVVRGLSTLTGPSGPNGELGELLSAQEARVKLGEELLTCGGQASCLPRALAALRVNLLFATELSVAGKSYAIAMRLYDGQGRELTHAEELCEICTVREADEAITKTAARLAAAARTFPIEALPTERTKPSPPPKPSPPREEPPPQPKVSPMEQPPSQPVAVVVKERKRVPWRALGFGSFGLGLVGLAIGIPLLVIDGRPTCDAADPARQCPELYNTAGGGAAMVAIGAIGLVAAVPLLYLDYRDRNRAVTALRLRGTGLNGRTGVLGGAAFTLEGAF